VEHSVFPRPFFIIAFITASSEPGHAGMEISVIFKGIFERKISHYICANTVRNF
jgi:hypothetical protein